MPASFSSSSRFLQQLQPLVDDAQVEALVPRVVIGGGERQQVVDLEAVDDRNPSPRPRQGKRQVMSDEAGPSNQHDPAFVEMDHVTSPRPGHP